MPMPGREFRKGFRFQGFEIPAVQHRRSGRRSPTDVPAWVRWSVAGNICCVLVLGSLGLLALRSADLPDWAEGDRALATATTQPPDDPHPPQSYPAWVEQRTREAEMTVKRHPARLAVLAGDSLSQAFPRRLLPDRFVWLNQGISGETSQGLLDRLDRFDAVRAEAIFVAIGINDALRGISDDTILENHRQIIRHLRRNHPRARIVIQSLLPHRAEAAIWEGRNRLRRAPNARIRAINVRLAQLARSEGAIFLNLQPMFVDATGKLAADLTTDGLHLSDNGYRVWRAAIDTFAQLYLDPAASRAATNRSKPGRSSDLTNPESNRSSSEQSSSDEPSSEQPSPTPNESQNL